MDKTKVKKIYPGFIFAVILVLADQYTKVLAVRHLKGQEPFVLLSDIFELRYLENRGAAFGILQNQKMFFVVLTIVVAVLLIYLLIFRIPDEKRYHPLNFILILFLSGAVGNFIDRVSRDYVVDFFYFKLIDFPIFNVADIYVVTAAILLLVFGLFYYKDSDYEKIFPSKKHG